MNDAPATLVRLLEASLERWPDREFIGTRTMPGPTYEWVTYRTFGRRVDAVRAGLARLGVGRGGTVGIISNNRLEWAIAHYATLGRAAAWVPMYEAELPATWEHILRDGGVEVLFVANRAIAEKVAAIQGRLPALRVVVRLDGEGEGTLAALEADGLADPVPAEHPAPDDLAVIIYTSGTTGDAKGVELTHRNLVSNHVGRRRMFPEFSEDSRTLSILPWAHVYGMGELHTWTELGGSIGLVGSVDTLLGDFALVRPTFLLAVPRVFTRVYNAVWARVKEGGGLRQWIFTQALAAARRRREAGPSWWNDAVLGMADRLVFRPIRERFGGRLAGVMTGSAAMSKEISQFFRDVGIPLYDVYGMTETSPGVTLNCPGAWRAGSVGRVMEGVRVEIDRSVVEEGAVDGEIVVYGPNVMRGYHGKPEATAAVLTPTGGMRTGDRGRLDADGFLYITGRIKDQFKLENGKYVFPAAIEEVLDLHPLVQTSFVYGDGRPSCVALLVLDAAAVRAWAERTGVTGDHAELVARDDLQAFVVGELKASLQGRFGSYEIPKRFGFVTEPFTVANGLLTQTMKLKRRPIVQLHQERIDALYR